MATTVDAIVIGSGVNGLVAAAELAKAGWSVALVEQADRLGGFITTEERTVPGYLHDTYSSWHPLFVSGAAYAALGPDLHRHGLRYLNTDAFVTATAADDGRVILAHRDPKATAAAFAHPEDTNAYLAMLQRFLDNADAIGGFLGSELRSPKVLRHAAALLRHEKLTGTETWLRDALTSGRSYCRREFRGDEADLLWVPWLLHAGLSPDHASGGLMVPILAATIHGFGLPVVEGGAGRFVDAFRALLTESQVDIRTGCSVERVVLNADGRAIGVVCGGETLRARRAVLASVTPSALYTELLPSAARVSPTVRAQAAQFRHGRSAMQIHVALSSPLAWNDERLATVPLLHLSDGSASTAIACAEADAGLLPRRPTVVVGQQHVLDPGRVPDGGAALWLQLQELPFVPTGDAADELDVSGGWTKDLAEGYARRVIARVARHAPDLPDKLLAFDVVTPADLNAANPNAVAGDPYGGSAELDQNLLWRPLPAAARHATPVPGLWHIGASTHPGPGLGGGSGHLVAQQLLHPGLRSRRR
ncbi:phytoene desaturase family protein [Streptomyces ureilyticus]|uniref:Pyridine nucleotide-disulfide oxidoreductase domain-containing protein 2 n=1 Tax=Streptomyces ureilyticus TaxID=1775131 RepID=A0ABX0DZQ3_9ACTN|nr:NAD(P)/FAD-dependent oxidoreductase [Streptomyces ureilyticus]NGO46394.1 NAD(P)/FAD-dependent oxidoreductase [Streptomyces ureilyticus]